MKRAHLFLAQAALTLTALVAAGGTAAAGSLSASDAAGKRTTHSFNVVYPVPSQAVPVILPSNGTGLAPAKAVVTNPYAVPLFQNAGALRSGR